VKIFYPTAAGFSAAALAVIFLTGCPGDALSELEQQLMEENEVLSAQVTACEADKASAEEQLEELNRQSSTFLGTIRNAVICGAGQDCAEIDCSTLNYDHGSICNNFKQYDSQCDSALEACE
jgi:hypothetical protein